MRDRAARIAVLGAGPVGLEAALYARSLGYATTIYERSVAAANVDAWGHIRLFSPWAYNRSPLGVRRLRDEAMELPAVDDTACPTGRELIDAYLRPLTRLPELEGNIREHTEVVACGRRDLLKRDLGNGIDRSRTPFQLLVRTTEGIERYEPADVVIDATGVFGENNLLGDGGIPALGESALTHEIEYTPPDITGVDRDRYADRHTMVIGAGYSAATTAVALAELRRSARRTRVTWVCRSEGDHPVHAQHDDPLPQRQSLCERANALVDASADGVDHLAGYSVAAIRRADGQLAVELRHRSGRHLEVRADRIVANVGYHPNERIYRQLHVHECYATLGPIELAASLMGQDSVDCLAVKAGGADLLRTPEPGFFILGAKSFGTNPTFLIRLGHEHIVQLFALITGEPDLNLYVDAAA